MPPEKEPKEQAPKEYSDKELVDLADWAEHMESVTPTSDWKRAYQAIRLGCDLLLRRRTKSRPEG